MLPDSNVKLNILYIVLKCSNATYSIQEQMYVKVIQNVNQNELTIRGSQGTIYSVGKSH